jgi:hypothetical protein
MVLIIVCVGGEQSQIHYFRCVEILEKFKETAERGVLGSLKGDAGKWEKIVKAYESSMLHVAEGGLILSRNVDYEIPYHQKQTTKHRQQMEDLEKKSIDLRKNAQTSHEQFLTECARVGVSDEVVQDGESLDASLIISAESLPGDVGAFTSYIKSNAIGDIIAYYGSFVKEHFGMDETNALLPVLGEVLQGTTDPVAGDVHADWINFGTSLAEDVAVYGMDPTLGESQEEVAGIEISWDGLELNPGDADAQEIAEQAIDISWDIDVSGAGEADASMDCESKQGESTTSRIDKQMAISRLVSSLEAQDNETRRITLDPSYRGKVLDDILELRAFVAQRVKELKSNSTVFSDTKEDASSVESMLQIVSHAADMLRSDDILNKISIITSKAHRDRIARKLLTMSGKETKQLIESEDADGKRVDIQRMLVSDSAKQSALVRETRQIKEAVELALGSKIKRKVNIQGAIHNVLKA